MNHDLARTNGWIHRHYGVSLLYRRELQQGSIQLAAARNYIPNANLRDLLDLLAKYTEDPNLWENLVQHAAEDLKTNAGFVASRRLTELETKIQNQAQSLQHGTMPAPHSR